MMSQPRRTRLLRVDPTLCTAAAVCVHLAADLITVDSWGYPILPTRQLSDRERRSAAVAVAACPRKALFLEAGISPG